MLPFEESLGKSLGVSSPHSLPTLCGKQGENKGSNGKDNSR
jgi:hypothetical protein